MLGFHPISTAPISTLEAQAALTGDGIAVFTIEISARPVRNVMKGY